MFGINSANGYREILPGISIKALAHGKSMLMAEMVLNKGSSLPKHRHANEQTGYLVKGNIRLTVDGAVRDIKPGDSWDIAGNIEHGAEIIEDSLAVEVFCPVREDYLKYVNGEDIAP